MVRLELADHRQGAGGVGAGQEEARGAAGRIPIGVDVLASSDAFEYLVECPVVELCDEPEGVRALHYSFSDPVGSSRRS